MMQMFENCAYSLTLSYSVAEYAVPVWVRSAHAYKLDSELKSIEELYFLSGIAPPSIIQDVCARVEKPNKKQTKPTIMAAVRCLKYRNCFLHSVKPANSPLKS